MSWTDDDQVLLDELSAQKVLHESNRELLVHLRGIVDGLESGSLAAVGFDSVPTFSGSRIMRTTFCVGEVIK